MNRAHIISFGVLNSGLKIDFRKGEGGTKHDARGPIARIKKSKIVKMMKCTLTRMEVCPLPFACDIFVFFWGTNTRRQRREFYGKHALPAHELAIHGLLLSHADPRRSHAGT